MSFEWLKRRNKSECFAMYLQLATVFFNEIKYIKLFLMSLANNHYIKVLIYVMIGMLIYVMILLGSQVRSYVPLNGFRSLLKVK